MSDKPFTIRGQGYIIHGDPAKPQKPRKPRVEKRKATDEELSQIVKTAVPNIKWNASEYDEDVMEIVARLQKANRGSPFARRMRREANAHFTRADWDRYYELLRAALR